ncbi:MAG TPA: hypothetical protein VHM93_23515, partial [Candidatus Acidoferrum sp.]|nr:hypothetical protein [Candidatus Acidoferrum sp.]
HRRKNEKRQGRQYEFLHLHLLSFCRPIRGLEINNEASSSPLVGGAPRDSPLMASPGHRLALKPPPEFSAVSDFPLVRALFLRRQNRKGFSAGIL